MEPGVRRYFEAIIAQQPHSIAEGDPGQHPGTKPAEKCVTPFHARPPQAGQYSGTATSMRRSSAMTV